MPTKSLSIALKSRLNSSAALRKNFTATGFNISRHYRRTLFLLLLFTFLFSHRRSGSCFFFQTGSLGQSPAAPAPPQQQEAEALPLTPLCVSANEGHSGCSVPKSAHTQSHTHLLPPYHHHLYVWMRVFLLLLALAHSTVMVRKVPATSVCCFVFLPKKLFETCSILGFIAHVVKKLNK